MNETADVVVIGGGVHGTSAVWQLARRGAGKIVLLEKEGIAAGATGWSSAIVRLHYTLEPLAAMALFGLRMFERSADELGGDCGFRRTGFLVLLNDQELEAGRAVVDMQRRLGIEARFLRSEEVGQLEPRLNRSDIAGGTYEPDSGYADGSSTANAFANAARREGADIRQGQSVTGIEVDAAGVARVNTSNGPIDTRTVLVAAGYRSSGLLNPLGVELPITPVRHSIAIIQRSAGFGDSHLIVSDRPAGAYYRPEGENLTLLGEMDPLNGHEDHDVEDEKPPSMEDQVTLISKFTNRFPGEDRASLRRGYTGVYDCTPDFQPALGPVAAVPGLFIAAGFSGHGFKLSPAAGRILSDLIVDSATTVADVSMFRIERFAAGKLITAGGVYASRSLA